MLTEPRACQRCIAVLLVAALVVAQCARPTAARTPFVLNIDVRTIDKVLLPGRRAAVKFDTEHPHGAFQDAFVEFAQLIAESAKSDEQRLPEAGGAVGDAAPAPRPRILVTEVRLHDHAPDAENTNLALLRRFDIDRAALPALLYVNIDDDNRWHIQRFSMPSPKRLSALALARWLSRVSGVHLHFPELEDPDLDEPHLLFNGAMQAVLDGAPHSTLQQHLAQLVMAVERLKAARRQTKVLSEVTYHQYLLHNVVRAVREKRGGDGASLAARDHAVAALASEEASMSELLETQTHPDIRRSIERKLTILHLALLRLHHERPHLPRYARAGNEGPVQGSTGEDRVHEEEL